MDKSAFIYSVIIITLGFLFITFVIKPLSDNNDKENKKYADKMSKVQYQITRLNAWQNLNLYCISEPVLVENGKCAQCIDVDNNATSTLCGDLAIEKYGK